MLPRLIDFLADGRALGDLLGKEVAHRDHIGVVLAVQFFEMLLKHEANVVVIRATLHARRRDDDDSLHY